MPQASDGLRAIDVDYLARVEGEGSMKIRIRDGKAEITEFGIFEPPRFFEAFMRGRLHTEAPDITARICGICPIAYQMSSAHAMEQVMGITVGGQLRELRRLLYCGEWIESHVLHAAMLHAPDFLGYQSAIHMAADHRETVELVLRLKKIGNDLVTLLAGREIHPINVKVGGWYRAPSRRELDTIVDDLVWAKEASLALVQFAASLPMPELEQDYEFVSVCHPDEYPYNEGRIVSNKGLDIDVSEYLDTFEEIHVERSNALQSVIKGRGAYLVGPLARYSLNFEKLTPDARKAATDAGLGEVCRNPFQSIIVRAVETVYAVDEALRIIDQYETPAEPAVPYEVRAGVGHGATEAPRGTLYHRYEVGADGRIVDAHIMPPTAQNQQSIEADLLSVVNGALDLPDDELQWKLEQSIRNYDPCISCATHFLDLEVDRE
ncbi:MAG: Ni/Fe hydrogenase subunit alpha [Actinobacteria bacterium]|nr:Ni/Fe hydrogenase subunit alpha [Actinomycetota bacterium]